MAALVERTIDVVDGVVALAQRDDLTHDLGVIAAALGLGHGFFQLIGHILLFRLQLLKAFDELAQFVGGHGIGIIRAGHGGLIRE